MESIRRALTTSRRKDPKQNQLQSAAYREHRSFSLQDTSKPLLHISLPNIEQLNHTTPPLSPPTTQHTYHLPNALPELTQQQDHLIRHIAIIFMDSYPIEDEDLLALLDIHKKSSTTTTTTTAASLWGKLKTHILTPTTEPIHAPLPSPTTSEKKIGVSLSNLSHVPENALFEKWRSLCPSIVTCFSSNSLVPHFLRDCILAMIQQDLNTEGIFRKNGNIRRLKEMCETLDSQPNREDWTDFFNKQPVVQLAAFIKRYLRELPEPLLTYKLYKLFLMSNKAANLTESLSMLHYSICLLPKPNRDILLLLLSLLNWVARHAETNKMDFGNLARVISPNILYESKKQTGYDISDVPNEFNLFLEHPTLTECLSTNNIDLISTRQFTRSFNNLLKVKKEIMTSNHFTLPPSPSISSKYL
ncbi:Rho GTPase activation protein [Cokeromyces recurvatus]|uniref:Rho GTPase activation protein n=1 Tax=Cokeromyces recurvatus TaxID=90255 RepID=UPI00221F5400|nr:Rho GTPase activation protein [Cokeromyces recurvatus]KAI7901552.1 Rho GTPase activation protein [Cokeromyces recurvatus]